MLNFLSLETSSEQEIRDHGEGLAESGACLVAVWLTKDGDFEIVSNVAEGQTLAILAGAVSEMCGQDGGTAH